MKKPDAAWLAAGLTGIYTLCMLLVALWRNDGHFVYALDDPYIHLDLARQLATTGVYGVNPGEVSAPLSSILWPFFVYPPYPVGVLGPVAGAAVLGGLCPPHLSMPARVALALFGVLLFNLPGLALMGMEHGLHILLSLLAALGCIRVVQGDKPPAWLWPVIFLHPLLRYEGVLVSAAALALLLRHGYWRQVFITGILLCLPVLAFTAFLSVNNLGLVPTSTLVKKLNLVQGLNGLGHFWLVSLIIGLKNPAGIALMASALALLFCSAGTISRFKSRNWFVLFTLAGLMTGHILLGRLSTWEAPRYDYYAVVFMLPVLLRVFGPRLRGPVPAAAIAALIGLYALPGLWFSTLDQHRAISSIYQQQYQMGRLVRDYWHEPVAANDIGAIGFESKVLVLDLIGLSSKATLMARLHHEPDWANGFVRRLHVPLVMIYRSWLEPELRASWTPLGELYRASHSSLGDDSVLFLTPYPERADAIRAVLDAWAKGLPPGAQYVRYDARNPAPPLP